MNLSRSAIAGKDNTAPTSFVVNQVTNQRDPLQAQLEQAIANSPVRHCLMFAPDGQMPCIEKAMFQWMAAQGRMPLVAQTEISTSRARMSNAKRTKVPSKRNGKPSDPEVVLILRGLKPTDFPGSALGYQSRDRSIKGGTKR